MSGTCHGCKGHKEDISECRTTVQIGNGVSLHGPAIDCTVHLCERCIIALRDPQPVGFHISVPAQAHSFRRRSK
jgi:hypothetical protein